MSPRTVNRRDFLITGGTAAAAAALALRSPAFARKLQRKKSRVVLVRHAEATDRLNRTDGEVLAGMLDEAMAALFNAQDAATAWSGIIRPDDAVGIKTNVWSYLRTPTELEDIVRARLRGAGVDDKRISVDDRGVHDNAAFRSATALINMRPMRTHHWSGLGTLIKNYIMFIDRPSDWHGDSCADLAAIWKQQRLAERTRLNVLVMLTPLFHGSGAHHFNPEYVWRYNGLILGTDPVAVDAVGARIIEAKRRAFFGEERPINPPPKHIDLAQTRHGLGVADPARIDLVTLGWKKDMLIEKL